MKTLNLTAITFALVSAFAANSANAQVNATLSHRFLDTTFEMVDVRHDGRIVTGAGLLSEPGPELKRRGLKQYDLIIKLDSKDVLTFGEFPRHYDTTKVTYLRWQENDVFGNPVKRYITSEISATFPAKPSSGDTPSSVAKEYTILHITNPTSKTMTFLTRWDGQGARFTRVELKAGESKLFSIEGANKKLTIRMDWDLTSFEDVHQMTLTGNTRTARVPSPFHAKTWKFRETASYVSLRAE